MRAESDTKLASIRPSASSDIHIWSIHVAVVPFVQVKTVLSGYTVNLDMYQKSLN